jgi:hypothetical protein
VGADLFEQGEVDASSLTVVSAPTDIPVHGIFLNEECNEGGYVIVALEAPDN